MNIRFYGIAFVATLVMSACLCSCGSDEQKSKPVEISSGREDVDMKRTAADTIAIRNLTIDYLNKLYENDFDGALDMLNCYNDSTSTLSKLSDEQRSEMLTVLQMFPVVGYTIDEINIFSENDTEVRYTIEMFKRENGDDRPNTMRFQLNPCRFGNVWYLCVNSQFRQTDKIRREDVR